MDHVPPRTCDKRPPPVAGQNTNCPKQIVDMPRKKQPKRKGKVKRRRQPAPKKSAKCKTSSGGLGRQLGANLGGLAQTMATKAWRSITGSGDYKVEQQGIEYETQANSVIEPRQASVPRFGAGEIPDGIVRIQKREYLGDIKTGTGVPVITEFNLNPAAPKTFPWLASIANHFEQWSMLGCVFEFKSTSGFALSSTNASLGTVVMATQYNVLEPSFITKTEALNHYFASSGKPSDDILHPIECAPTEKQFAWYTVALEAGPIPPGDLRITQMGRTTILTVGSQSGYTAGELWITYDILLAKPRVPKVTIPEEKVDGLEDYDELDYQQGFISPGEMELPPGGDVRAMASGRMRATPSVRSVRSCVPG